MMKAMKKRVLLLGASGLTGGHCLRLLLEDGRVGQVLVVGRRAVDVGDARVLQFVADPVTEVPDEAFEADYAICCLGTTRKKAGGAQAFRAIDLDLTLALAGRAKAAGVERFALVSAVGASPRAWSLYSRTKGELEEAVRGLGFGRLIIARPSLLLGGRGEARALEDLGQRLAGPMGALARVVYPRGTPIEAEVLARGLIRAIFAEDGPAEQVLYYEELMGG